MERVYGAIARLSAAVWVGGGLFFVAVAAPAAFSGSENPTFAARTVGEMLARWHGISVLCPLLILAGRSFRRRFPLILIVLAVVLANGQWRVDARIHQIRVSVEGPVSDLAPEDPMRRRFGALHGISMMLLVGQLVCGVGLIAGDRDSGTASPGGT